ncbi:MAG: hypothetical protein K5841_07115 [Fretibacterium sp.]|nr:hypothetical protein [Fretibacterium sp.]
MSNYFEQQREKMRIYFEERERRAAEAATKAATKKAEQTFAMKLIQRGKDTMDEIAECTGLTLRQVKALAKAAAV